MSSTPESAREIGRAETAFRDAFERLKKNRPRILPKASRVTQNNVAREAGLVPSALRKSRFPDLIAEIKAFGSDDKGQSSAASKRRGNKKLRERIEAVERQRDEALSALLNAEATIVELFVENDRLQALMPAGNVAPIGPRKS